jgi:hypothetical protein
MIYGETEKELFVNVKKQWIEEHGYAEDIWNEEFSKK